MISVDELVPSSRADSIREIVADMGSLKSLSAIKDACPSDVTYQDIVLVIASLESSGA